MLNVPQQVEKNIAHFTHGLRVYEMLQNLIKRFLSITHNGKLALISKVVVGEKGGTYTYLANFLVFPSRTECVSYSEKFSLRKSASKGNGFRCATEVFVCDETKE